MDGLLESDKAHLCRAVDRVECDTSEDIACRVSFSKNVADLVDLGSPVGTVERVDAERVEELIQLDNLGPRIWSARFVFGIDFAAQVVNEVHNSVLTD